MTGYQRLHPGWLFILDNIDTPGAITAVQRLLPSRPTRPPDDVRACPVWDPLRPHIEQLIHAADAAGIADPTALLMNDLGLYLRAKSLLREAETLMRRALAIDEASFGSEHPDVARDLNNLALLLKATNRLAEADPLLRRALAIDDASFGIEHPRVTIDLNSLALLLQDTNRLEEAEPMSRQTVEIFLLFTMRTGHEHPNLNATFGNYMGLLAAMGRDEEEQRLDIEALFETAKRRIGS